MPGLAQIRNIGAYLKGLRAVVNLAVTAGGGGDGAEVDGPAMNRADFQSGQIQIPYTTTLGDGDTLTLVAKLQESADGTTGWTDAPAIVYQNGQTALSSELVTGGSGGSTETGVYEKNVNLSYLKEFVRVVFTPTLSAGATDTVALAGVLAVTVAQEVPVDLTS